SATPTDGDNAVSYAWYSSADNDAIATGATYVVKEIDEGHTIEVKATATNEQGLTDTKTSAVTAAVTDAAPTVSTPVTPGTAQERQSLPVAAVCADGDSAVTYAWYSSADNYINAIGTGATYVVKEIDEGHTIEVKATATNHEGLTDTNTSTATGAVTDAA